MHFVKSISFQSLKIKVVTLVIMQNGKQIQRNYCLFWVKERTGDYIEEFADLLRKLLCSEKQKKDV